YGTSHITEVDDWRPLPEPATQRHVRHVSTRSRRVEVLRYVVRLDSLLVRRDGNWFWPRWAARKPESLSGRAELLPTLITCAFSVLSFWRSGWLLAAFASRSKPDACSTTDAGQVIECDIILVSTPLTLTRSLMKTRMIFVAALIGFVVSPLMAGNG